jgi:ferredoxin
MYVIAVDLTRCMGHGQCYGRAPGLMEAFDDFGHARFSGEPIDPSDDARVAEAKATIRNCPEYALRWKRLSEEEE